MANLINAKCPNCGAVLELPANLDRAFCIHCGGKVIIARDETHYHKHEAQKTAIACPECQGKGYFVCTSCRGHGGCLGSYTSYTGNRPVTVGCQMGWCPKCKGQGKISKILYTIPCDYCQGSRFCPTCRGAGRCISCNGTGKITCQPCNGTGFKVYRGD
jgi:DnaJ-class molecular chaperone